MINEITDAYKKALTNDAQRVLNNTLEHVTAETPYPMN
jgi:hypothetical protein